MVPDDRPIRLAIVAVLVFALGAALLRFGAAPAGAVEPAWDRVACAHCRMLVSDPRFAAQLHTRTGEVRFYDDPGCLLVARPALGDHVASVWFHDSAGGSWLPEAGARFVPVAESPMGYGFAAVSAAERPDALDAAAVLAELKR